MLYVCMYVCKMVGLPCTRRGILVTRPSSSSSSRSVWQTDVDNVCIYRRVWCVCKSDQCRMQRVRACECKLAVLKSMPLTAWHLSSIQFLGNQEVWGQKEL